jgi:hypothetical protein
MIVREVQPRELAMKFDGGGVISARRFLGSVEAPKMCLATPNHDLGAISTSRQPDALEAIFRSAGSRPVPKILGVRAEPQIFTAVIQRIAVDVVDQSPAGSRQNLTVHPYVSASGEFRSGSSDGIYPAALASACVPFMGVERIEVSRVHQGRVALRQSDFANAPRFHG